MDVTTGMRHIVGAIGALSVKGVSELCGPGHASLESGPRSAFTAMCGELAALSPRLIHVLQPRPRAGPLEELHCRTARVVFPV